MRNTKSTTNKAVGNVIEALETTIQKELKDKQEKIMQSIANGKRERDELTKSNKSLVAEGERLQTSNTAFKAEIERNKKALARVVRDTADKTKEKKEELSELTVTKQEKADIKREIEFLKEKKETTKKEIQSDAQQLLKKVTQVDTTLQGALSLSGRIKEDLQQYVKNSVNE